MPLTGIANETSARISVNVDIDPDNRDVRFDIEVLRQSAARLVIYDAVGRVVAVPFDGALEPGVTHGLWDARPLHRAYTCGACFATAAQQRFSGSCCRNNLKTSDCHVAAAVTASNGATIGCRRPTPTGRCCHITQLPGQQLIGCTMNALHPILSMARALLLTIVAITSLSAQSPRAHNTEVDSKPTPMNPGNVVTGNPCLNVADLVFGSLRKNESRTLPLRICNDGDGEVTFNNPTGGLVIEWLSTNFTRYHRPRHRS